MFWRMTNFSSASPVEAILDKDNFSLEELLDEDEIIQECKALNARLINFLRERSQLEQLIRYIVEEASEDAEKHTTFKIPFVSCEILTCEVDIILRTLVEDEELMGILFSFLDPNRPHSTSRAGYFSKVFTCILSRKTVPVMNYIQDHKHIVKQMVDLIGITSIMEVLIRLIGADEHIYANFPEAETWLEDADIFGMIVDKFSSSDSPEVHSNAAETLCAIIRYAPHGLAEKVSSASFVGRLFNKALEESRPRSVLVSSLSVFICLLDPRRFTSGTYYAYSRQYAPGSFITANPEIVQGMLESLGSLINMLDVTSDGNVLPTSYGKLHPPLGKHRLKIIELIEVLLLAGGEAAERELIKLGVLRRILLLFFEYPYNNFLHHHGELIIVSCLESKSFSLIGHILQECNLIAKILEAEKCPILTSDAKKPAIPVDGKTPPRMGYIGHITRISNKLITLGNYKSEIRTILQENNEWAEWSSTVLSKRNAVENVFQWACGRPTSLLDQTRDGVVDDYQDRDYDVAALADNLSQAFQYGIYNNQLEKGSGSLERDDEDVYFDDESAEVVISSLCLGDDQEGGSLCTNWDGVDSVDGLNNDAGSVDAVAAASPSSGYAEESGAVASVDKDETNAPTIGGNSRLSTPEMESDPMSSSEKSTNSEPKITDATEEQLDSKETSSSSGGSETTSKQNVSKDTEPVDQSVCQVSNELLSQGTTNAPPSPEDPMAANISGSGNACQIQQRTESLAVDAVTSEQGESTEEDAIRDSATSSDHGTPSPEKTEKSEDVGKEAREM